MHRAGVARYCDQGYYCCSGSGTSYCFELVVSGSELRRMFFLLLSSGPCAHNDLAVVVVCAVRAWVLRACEH